MTPNRFSSQYVFYLLVYRKLGETFRQLIQIWKIPVDGFMCVEIYVNLFLMLAINHQTPCNVYFNT